MLEERHFKTLVLGVGNRIMSDEGIGVHLVERLCSQFSLPEEIQVLDGGTLGLDLIYFLEGIENLLIVDAVQADLEPGGMLRLQDDAVPAFMSIKISPHQVGVPDMLFAAKLRGVVPRRIVLWGVQPERVELGMDLSPLLESKMDALMAHVLDELLAFGHQVTPK